jgi:DNA repair protein RAD5
MRASLVLTRSAINLYLDGSWATASAPTPAAIFQPRPPVIQTTIASSLKRAESEESVASQGSGASTPMASILRDMPSKRYIGSFGVIGWATTSGTGLLKHNEKVSIERYKMQPKGKKRIVALKKQDVVVRFKNERGQEVGRLDNDSAPWISALIDQKCCSFEGSCVYVPDRIRTSDTIYLQLHGYFLRSAFDKRKFTKPEDNREVSLFEEKETSDERDLRMRQVGMVKLFEAINLHPTRQNESTQAPRTAAGCGKRREEGRETKDNKWYIFATWRGSRGGCRARARSTGLAVQESTII